MPKPIIKRKGKTMNHKMEVDELMSMIKNTLKEVIDGQDEEKEFAEPTAPEEEVAEKEFESSLQKAIESVLGKRKALSDAGEALGGEINAEEIIAEMAAMMDACEDAAEYEDEEKADEEEAREDGTAFPSEAPEPQKSRKKPVTHKSATYPAYRKTAQAYEPPLQRKYASLFTSAPSAASAPNEGKAISPCAKLSRVVKCSNWSHGDPEKAAYFARTRYGDERLERSYKALNTTSPTAGGYLIPEVYSDEIIELLYAQTFLTELGARKVAMPNGTITFPGFLNGSTATWRGENRKIDSTQPGYRSVKMSAKTLSALIPMSNEFLEFNTFSNDEIYGADLIKQISEKLESAALYGAGGDFQPLGILNTPDITKIDVSAITDATLVNGSHITASLFPIIQAAAMKNKINTDRLGWVFNPQVYAEILNAPSPLGDYTYRYEMAAKGTLMGAPYRVTTLLPVNDDGTSTIVYANWSDVLVGDVDGLRIETFREGTAHDVNGDFYSAVEQDGIIMRAVMRTDIALRHPQSVVSVNNVQLSYN
ncbi:hypothetical protein FACS1894184_14670 [Clostridia bacterium]|nr:hypothetical protein FACS1894184_14670 [Clostridia bacterium]